LKPSKLLTFLFGEALESSAFSQLVSLIVEIPSSIDYIDPYLYSSNERLS